MGLGGGVEFEVIKVMEEFLDFGAQGKGIGGGEEVLGRGLGVLFEAFADVGGVGWGCRGGCSRRGGGRGGRFFCSTWALSELRQGREQVRRVWRSLPHMQSARRQRW